MLRKANKIKTIHSSLAIEGNTLNEDQVRDIVNGKMVVAPLREIQEVKNAIATYEQFPHLNPFKEKDLLRAHGIMMQELVDHAGHYRPGNVGVFSETGCVHVAPPADRVPLLMGDLFDWLNHSKDHCWCVRVFSITSLSSFTPLPMVTDAWDACVNRSY